MIMLHMSRFAEDLILYSSSEFGFVALADAYSTGRCALRTYLMACFLLPCWSVIPSNRSRRQLADAAEEKSGRSGAAARQVGAGGWAGRGPAGNGQGHPVDVQQGPAGPALLRVLVRIESVLARTEIPLTKQVTFDLLFVRRGQEDKEPLFDCADTLRACSQIADGVVTTLRPNREKMLAVGARCCPMTLALSFWTGGNRPS